MSGREGAGSPEGGAMDPRERLAGELLHDAWANRRTLECLEAAAGAPANSAATGPATAPVAAPTVASAEVPATVPAGAPKRVTGIMAHIIGAEWLWLRRLGCSAPELSVWPDLAPAECDRHLRQLAAAWRSFLETSTPENLGREVSYTNTKGESWSNQVGDILTHVALHSAYHRGQIATILREAGVDPPYTDYIEFIRRGHRGDGWPRLMV